MAFQITPIILAGGTGTRLWPLSRAAAPKQFQEIVGTVTTFQNALLRVQHPQFTRPIVLTGAEFHFVAQRQAQELGIDPLIVIEPVGRNSAAAIAAGAVLAKQRLASHLAVAMPADQHIANVELFRRACEWAVPAADRGYIVTFGTMPTEPRTSLGYIQPGEQISPHAHQVQKFVEKPDAPTAERYLREGYLWNSGHFLFRPDTVLDEVRQQDADLIALVDKAINAAKDDLGFLRLERSSFERIKATSFDYLVMEKTSRAAVVRADFAWSDLGSWDSLAEVVPADEAGNVLQGRAAVLGAKDCIVHSSGRLTALVDVEGLIVVSTADAVLVVSRANAQRVRDLVSRLGEQGGLEVTQHLRVDRPWGYYERLDFGDRFQVKRILVQPGGMLSLQSHAHRAEHWVVVRGTADVVIGDSHRTLEENESIYIPIGSVHRLGNKGQGPLEIIEVQTGDYLGEDDIVRYHDIYNRNN